MSDDQSDQFLQPSLHNNAAYKSLDTGAKFRHLIVCICTFLWLYGQIVA